MATNGTGVAAPSAGRVDAVAKRTKIVEQFCTERTPVDARDAIIIAMDGEAPGQRRVTLSAAGARVAVFMRSKFIGGGIDGFVLLTDRELRKICEVLETHQRDAGCREIINGTIARLRKLPYIAKLESWTVWDGEATSRGVSNHISKSISSQLNRAGRPNFPRVLDIIEHVPDAAVRTRIQENWLKNRGQHPNGTARQTEEMYIEHKRMHIGAAMAGEKLLPHSYLILQQQNAGKFTFFSQFDYPKSAESLMNPYNWPKFRAQTLFIVHSQWVLQKLVGFRHRDFQPHNIVMDWVDRIPAQYSHFWLPELVNQIINGTPKARFSSYRPKLREFDGHVPMFIDLSRSMFNSKLSLETLALRPGCESNVRIQALVDQRRCSRTGDMRRLGIYMAYRVCHALESRELFYGLSADTKHSLDKLDAWMHSVSQAFDWRFVTVTMNLCLPPREWVEFIARRPAKAATPLGKNYGQVSESFRAFVDKMIRVQCILQSLLSVVGPINRGNRTARHEASRRIARQRPGITQAVDDLIKDLNPYSDYIESESFRTREGDWQLPEKIIEWDIWTL